MGLNCSGNEELSSVEVSWRIRWEVTRPSLDVLSDLLVLQIHHDLFLPLEKVILGKPRKAIRSARRVGRHVSEIEKQEGGGVEAEQPKK